MMCPLTELQVGQEAEVIGIESREEGRLLRLSTYGLVPGSRVTLRQRSFAYVVMVGETEVALDTEVAREIIVRPCKGRRQHHQYRHHWGWPR